MITATTGWTGRYRDPLTGLQYNNARWYNPEIQRWMSEDPIWDGTNKYAYVGNRPTMYVDPTALSWWNRWTWFSKGDEWNKLVDEELALVQKLNQNFGTSHTSLGCFTPAERARIEQALGQKFDWDNTPIKASGEEFRRRDKVYGASITSLYVAGAADAAAGGLAVIQIAGGAGAAWSTAQRTTFLRTFFAGQNVAKCEQSVQALKWYQTVAQETLAYYETIGYTGVGIATQQERLRQVGEKLIEWGVK